MDIEGWVQRIRARRVRLAEEGPSSTRPIEDVGEAIVSTAGGEARHIIVDPFQMDAYKGVGWDSNLY